MNVGCRNGERNAHQGIQDANEDRYRNPMSLAISRGSHQVVPSRIDRRLRAANPPTARVFFGKDAVGNARFGLSLPFSGALSESAACRG